MSNRRHCACLFEEPSGPPVQHCSHHAMQRKEIERLQARVEVLEGVRDAVVYSVESGFKPPRILQEALAGDRDE